MGKYLITDAPVLVIGVARGHEVVPSAPPLDPAVGIAHSCVQQGRFWHDDQHLVGGRPVALLCSRGALNRHASKGATGDEEAAGADQR